MKTTLYVFNIWMLLLVAGALVWCWRGKSIKPLAAAFGMPMILMVLGTFGAVFNTVDVFGKFQLLAWAVFLHLSLYYLGAVVIFRDRDRTLSWFSGGMAALVLLVGVDAFLVEPHWLQVSRVMIPTEKVQQQIRIALIADVQTDRIGNYEERVFSLVRSEQPDLVLLAGDYLHFYDRYEEYLSASSELNDMLRNAGLAAPLGAYAVRGNVDRQDWTAMFTGLPVVTFDSTTRLDLGSIVLTALSFKDSADSNLVVESAGGFHIVLGHVPNFSLGEVEADLLVAGHTHGGQVQLPLLGPILTLSRVPRSWASGMTEIEPGKTLVVSRGIGLERVNAPRLRFLCRPELVIIDLLPAQ